ncbi:MAG TPA: SPFH domain-containing protein [Phycisphaerae bacterium]|nr:SPFH domain-containing protein [Phycisphaerae bacterium]
MTTSRIDRTAAWATSAALFAFEEGKPAEGRAHLRLVNVVSVASVQPEEVLALAGRVRWPANASIARAVADALAQRGCSPASDSDLDDRLSRRWHPVPFQGIDGQVGEFDVLLGTRDFVEDAGIPIPRPVQDLLAEHEERGWWSVLVGACRRGQTARQRPRSLIGVLAFESQDATSTIEPTQDRKDQAKPPARAPRFGLFRAWSGRLRVLLTRRVVRLGLTLAGVAMVSAMAGLWCSLLAIPADELAAIQRFGKSVALLGPGLHVRPLWLFETATRIQPRAVRSVQIGLIRNSETDTTDHPIDELMLTGDVWPKAEAVTQATRAASGKTVVRSMAQLVEARAVVQYGIAEPEAFLFRVRAPDAVVAVAAESVLRAVLAGHTLAECLGSQRGAIGCRAGRLLQERLDSLGCGIQIDAFHLEDIRPYRLDVGAWPDDGALTEIESGITAQSEADQLLADARRQALARVADAEAECDQRIRSARSLLEEVEAEASAYARDPQAARRRLLADLISRMPNPPAALRDLLLKAARPGVLPPQTREGGEP